MRHNKVGRQLGRNSSHRRAMFRNMVTSLFEHGKVKTTDAKAKELRKIAEKLITIGKKGDLAARRKALSYVMKKEIVSKLFEEISPGFSNRNGGYTRIIKIGNRLGDNAPVSLIELVTEPCNPKPKKAKAAVPQVKVEAPAPQVVPENLPVVGETPAE